ncbi:acyloxyacyl hydrolase [Aliiroseovarius sp. F47248L]|uniref:acyloxyacyl hydrolase n=1 Tax=Aliiroseovarius sp. F47248L TaxID=2926420 RepID=UPI001FF2182C|nr:acyloxyacyl hydrolase [Aliiroseovarius sp. F47248L]MCK0139920.1 acyloxyacyl hydrolase [Aliiroseovarius sp. F47248L]
MDGTLAVLFLLTGLIDMWVNHCNTGCVKPVSTVARHVASAGGLIFEADSIGAEAYYRHDLPLSYGPFQPTIGASVDSQGDIWIGLGAVNVFHLWGDRSFAQLSFMPGIWLRGDGPVMGHPIEFRSGIDAGYERPDGMRYSVSLDHRSNGDIVPVNPGLETLQFRVSVPAE